MVQLGRFILVQRRVGPDHPDRHHQFGWVVKHGWLQLVIFIHYQFHHIIDLGQLIDVGRLDHIVDIGWFDIRRHGGARTGHARYDGAGLCRYGAHPPAPGLNRRSADQPPARA